MVAAVQWAVPSSHPLDLDLPSGGTFEQLPEAWVNRPILDILADMVARFPDRLAIDDGIRQLSYQDFWSELRAVAEQVLAVAPPGPVGVLLPSSASFLVGVLACLAVRRVCIPLDLNYPVERNARILRAAGLAAIITDEAIVPSGLDLPAELARLGKGSGSLAPLAVPAGSNDDAALVVYTSGSTGEPKGIANSTASLLQRVLQYVNAGHLDEQDRFLTLSSPCTIAGMREMLTPLLIGAAVHIVSARRAGLREILRVVRDRRITVYNSVPAMLRSLLASASGPDAFASLRLVRLGGDVMFWSDVTSFRRVLPRRCAIQVGYSSTETIGSQWFVPDGVTPQGSFVPVGRLLPGLRAAVLDDGGEAAAPGQPGELLVRGRFVMLGHWSDGRVLPGPARPDPDCPASRILATGDLVRLRADGLVELIGRKDRQVKINGQRAEPSEVEAVLRLSAHVVDAAVLTIRDGETARFLGFVVPQPGAPATLASGLLATTRAALPAFMQPSGILLVNAIPRLPGGKLDPPALAALAEAAHDDTARSAAAPSAAAPFAAASGPEVPATIRQAVAQAWGDVVGHAALEHDLAFDDACGDSLKLMQLVFQMEVLLGRQLPLDLFAPGMRPSAMAEAIASGGPREPGPDGRPQVLLMPGINGDEPRLLHLRNELGGVLDFTVMQYPDWPDMVAAGMDFEALADHVFAQAVEAATTGSVVLVGYSYGGAVAYAVAERLLRAGREVALLVVFDTDAQPRPPQPALALPRLGLRWVHELARGIRTSDIGSSLGEFLAKLVAHPRMLPVLRLLAAEQRRLRHVPAAEMAAPRSHSGGRLAFAFHGWTRTFLRSAALRSCARWRDTWVVPVNIVLFRSEAHAPDTPPDLCWSRRCLSVSIFDVAGDHHTMLDAPHRKPLCERFEQVVRAALTEAPVAAPVGTSQSSVLQAGD